MTEKPTRKTTSRSFMFGDFDKDRVPNIDDKYPYDPTRRIPVDKDVMLTEEIRKIKRETAERRNETYQVTRYFRRRGYRTKHRMKTPYSTINKLRRKHLHEVKDLGAVAVLVDDRDEAYRVGQAIERDFKVAEKDDYYRKPKDRFYRALHYVVIVDGKPVEIQVKTKSAWGIHEAAHRRYKQERLTPRFKRRMQRRASITEKLMGGY